MTSGAVEEKVASNIGVQGSNHGRDCPVSEIFRMAKPTILTLKYRRKPIKTTKKTQGL